MLIKRIGMDIIVPPTDSTMEEMANEVLQECLQEAMEQPGENGMFDLIFEVDEDFNISILADDVEEEAVLPPPVQELQVVPEPQLPPVGEECDLDEERNHQQYVMARRNSNTVKKTLSVSTKQSPFCVVNVWGRSSREN